MPDTQRRALAFFGLEPRFTVNALPVCLGRAFNAAVSGRAWLERLAGVLFTGFCARLALSDNPLSAAAP